MLVQMTRFLTFRRTYPILTGFLLPVEAFIAVFVRDGFIRPYFGDVLVVALLYCLFRTFIKVQVRTAVISVFLFACCIEFLQYIHIVDLLGLKHSMLARIILGSSFSWLDLLAYAAGSVSVLALEKYFNATTEESISMPNES